MIYIFVDLMVIPNQFVQTNYLHLLGSNEIKPWEFFVYSVALTYNLYLCFILQLVIPFYMYISRCMGHCGVISNVKALQILLTY